MLKLKNVGSVFRQRFVGTLPHGNSRLSFVVEGPLVGRGRVFVEILEALARGNTFFLCVKPSWRDPGVFAYFRTSMVEYEGASCPHNL